MSSYITNLLVVQSDTSSVTTPSGWTPVNPQTNLNKGTSGRYIYLYYKTGATAPFVTGLDVIAGPITQDNSFAYPELYKPVGTESKPDSPADINDKAGPKYIYIYYTTETTAGPPIGNITIVDSDNSNVFPDSSVSTSWIRINQDTNDSSGGKYVYICYNRLENSP